MRARAHAHGYVHVRARARGCVHVPKMNPHRLKDQQSAYIPHDGGEL